MYVEAKSTELPRLSARRLDDMGDHPLPPIVPADAATALPRIVPTDGATASLASRPVGTSYASVPSIASGDQAALFFLRFDTSTHGDWAAIAPPLPQGLEAALEDLRSVPAEAEEEGIPPPTQLALSNAERILRRMHTRSTGRLEVYPTQDGEVAIVAPGKPRSSVMVLCDADGGALCMVNLDGVHRRARYSTADDLPDGFLRDALAELANRAG